MSATVQEATKGRERTRLVAGARPRPPAWGRVLIYALLIAGAVACMLPFIWLLRSSVMGPEQIFVIPPEWIPRPFTWSNYTGVLTSQPFNLYFLNTMFHRAVGGGGALISCSLSAYSFARLRWPGRDLVFGILLTSVMLPYAATLIPTFIMWRGVGAVNTFLRLQVPAWLGGAAGGVFNIFLLVSAAGSLRWFRDVAAVGATFADLVSEAERWGPGARGVTFLPYLAGERTPHANPEARGSFVGLALHHDRAALTRAVLEGIAYGLRDSLELLRSLGVHPESGRVSGGGAWSDLWLRIIASVLGLPLHKMAVDEGSAYGAAMLAGVAGGVFADVGEAVDACVRATALIDPYRNGRLHTRRDTKGSKSSIPPCTLPLEVKADINLELSCVASVESATRVARAGGRVALLGLAGASQTLELPSDRLVVKDLKVIGSLSYTTAVWTKVMRLLESRVVDFDALVTHRFPIASFEDAFSFMDRREGVVVKVLLEHGGDRS